MNEKNNENLNELFGRFFDASKSEQMVEDIAEGQGILDRYPVAGPTDAVISEIKNKLAVKLAGKRRIRFRHAVIKVSAVAAVFLVLSVITVKVFQQKQPKLAEVSVAAAVQSDSIWDSEDLQSDDADIATLSAEISQFESDLADTKSWDNGDEAGIAANNIEMELLDIESDFWKG